MEKSSGVMVEMGDHPPLKRPREVVSNQSGASSETPVAPNDLPDYTDWVDTDWVGNFIKAITSASDSDKARSRAANVFLFFEASLRPCLKSEIRKTLRQEWCRGGNAKPISSGPSSEIPFSPENLSDDTAWVDLIVNEVTIASDSDDARIRTTRVLEKFKASLGTFLNSQMRRELQQASGYAISILLGLDDSEEDEDDLVYESPPSMEMEAKMNCSVDVVSNQSGASSETPVAPKNMSVDTVWVDLILKEISSASDSNDARIRATRALASFKTSLCRDDSEEHENDMHFMPYEWPPKMEKKMSCSTVQYDT